MTTLNLSDIAAEARKRFAPIPVGLSDGATVELKPISRLGAKARKSVVTAVNGLKLIDQAEEIDDEEDDDDLADEIAENVSTAIAEILRLIASSPRKLIAELDSEEDPRIRAETYTAVLKSWTSQA